MAGRHIGWVALIAALWAQVYVGCVPAWRHGDYYSYGWYIPPLAAFFGWRLRGCFTVRDPAPIAAWILVLGGVALTAILWSLRVLERVDARWTLPLWVQAAVAGGVTVWVAQRFGGGRAAWRLLPVLAFAVTAIPLPSLIESGLVHGLTRSVVASTTALLNGLGLPAYAMGDRIASPDGIVHVTEGCSGIRSAQSFFMAALFFGEWMRLRVPGRVVLLFAGWITAWLLNVARATTLAMAHFSRGGEAADQLHDLAGLLAFILGSSILYFLAAWLDGWGASGRRRRSVERGGA